MKVLLIDPPYDRLMGMKFEWFPLGLLNIASFINQDNNVEVKVYNAEHATEKECKYLSLTEFSNNIHLYKDACNDNEHHVWKEVQKVIEDYSPDVVGISVLTPKLTSAMRIAEITKEVDSKTIVVCGNHQSTSRPNELLTNRFVDFLIRGEGEQTFLELIQTLIAGAKSYEEIEGLSFKKNGDIINNDPRKLLQDLHSLPIPDRSLLWRSDTYSNDQLSMVMTSRGCPFNCGFCASSTIWKRKVRFRNIDHVFREIRELKDKYGIKNITFMDDSFTISSKRVEAFCNALIAERMNITWSCLTRVDIITDSLIELMKKAGCSKVVVGIESGSERMLEFTNKGITLSAIRNAVKILKRHNIFWAGFFLFGLPTETEEEIMETVNFMKELKPDWAHISLFTPYPETALYNYCINEKICDENIDYDMYTHQYAALDFTGEISKERGNVLALHLLKEVHQYNSSLRSLTKRVISRKYHKKPSLIVSDMKKALSWLK